MSLQNSIAADIAHIFSDVTGGFAQKVTTTTGRDYWGIFQDDYYAANPGGAFPVSSTQPVFRIPAASASGLTRGKALLINSVPYEIVEAQPANNGVTDFRLKKA